VSATNRGAERASADYYPTPAWCVRRLLEACPIPAAGGPELRPRLWLEPCVGDGAIVRAVNGVALIAPTWISADIRESCEPTWLGSYLDWLPPRPDVIITNPPFSLSFPIAQKALRDCPQGHVALLLRLNWLGSGTESGRSEWLRKNPPDVYVLPNRPAFVASLGCKAKCGWKSMQALAEPRPRACPTCGGVVSCSTTDATEYAWFVWTPDRERTRGSIQVLAETPEEERSVSAGKVAA